MAYMLRFSAFLTVGVTLAILAVLLADAFEFFRRADIADFLTGTKWEPFGEPKRLGIWPLLTGTLMTAGGAVAFALPLGAGMAIYLTQYASRGAREAIGPAVEILGGIPTLVYGYFALTTVTPFLKKHFFPELEIFNALSASIVVGIGIMPLITSLSAEALRLVPSSVKNAGYALGMRKITVITRILLPAASSGIIASVILAFSRALGETMAVTLAAGATPSMSLDYLKGIQTITAFIVQISLGDTPAGSIEYYTIYALGLVLFALTFVFNIAAVRVVRRLREIYQ